MNLGKCQVEKITIRKNRLSKYIRLSINPKGQVLLSAPPYCSQKQISAFVNKHLEWIQRQKEKMTPPLVFQKGRTISLLGQSYTITHCPDSKQGVHPLAERLIVSGEECFIHRRITDYIKSAVYNYITHQASLMAQKLEVSYQAIHLKDTTSRWGSCSGKKNLNFCWRLGLAPLFVLDYVIAHEISHLREMNHSSHFWALVDKLTPNRKKAELWLKQNGQKLR